MYALFRLACVVLAIVPVYCDGRRQQYGTCDICNCLVKDVVDCSDRSLTYIPKDLNVTTRELNLSSNYLQHIDNGNFEYLEELISLDLYNTSLKNVSSDAFKGLTNLKFLNISQNDQFPLTNESTPMELFEHIPSLEVLRMYGTTGTYNIKNGYPDVQLSKLPSLEELWIDGLTNLTFGPAFRNMTSLKVLRLAGDFVEPSWRSKEFCMTDLVEGMFDNVASITHLYIRKCYVTHIDKNVFQNLKNLEYLDLSENKKVGLEDMFNSFCSLSNTTTSLILNSVTATETCGAGITKQMVKCIENKSIRELQLNHNKIRHIDTHVFSTLPKTLQILRATSNFFDLNIYIFYIFHMTNLTHLDISYQFFTDEISVWLKKEYTQEPKDAMLFTSSTDNILTDGNRNERLVSHDEYTYSSEQSEDHGGSHGGIFHGYAQQLLLDITHQNLFQYKTQNTGKVCPQLIRTDIFHLELF
ncbi:toll-like receptor 4 [Mercenaria mercenaria]|uniref:toll-like receptor 4 n=1 Tax=Mercenaria mercenaria TaxID=6596 RepID=UPI00234F3A62|nr:toll-like receptor 4 [Mercenaria mercenaria]